MSSSSSSSSSSSPAKSIALAIAPKFTAILSICGSFGIVLKVLFHKSRRNHTMHRIVLGMSICDILAGIWYFTSTWAIPAGTMSGFGDGEIFWAAGDAEGVSCSFAGFFNQFAVASPLYNTTLSIYFLLIVNYGWADRSIAKIEWILHGIPVGYALITSIFAVAANLYGQVEWTCWIFPGGVKDETQELTSIQSKFQWIQWIFLFGVVWMCIIVVTTVFVVLYRKMKSLERIMKRYTYSTTNGKTEVSTSVDRNTKLDIEEAARTDASRDNTSNSNTATKRNDEEVAESPATQSKVWFAISKMDKNANEANGGKPKASAQREVAKKSKKIAVQGLLYVGAFYITWLFPTITRITQLAFNKNYFAIQFLDTFLIPLQGFFNFLIYSRPTYLKYRRRGKTFWEAFRTAIFEINVD